MLIIKLQGGLGNQMFQYAAGKALAGKSLSFDTGFLQANQISTGNFSKRDMELSIFQNIKFKKPNKFLKYLIIKNLPFFSKYIYQSEKNEFIDFKAINVNHLYLDGYFQNELYFSFIRPQLLIDFEFPKISEHNEDIRRKIMEDEAAVGIHIRRGDYLQPAIQAFHGLLGLDYYKSAKDEIAQKIKHPHYYIFSDDIAWCKLNISFSNSTFVSNPLNKNWEDMHLMSLCKHNIVANSSYSWWGAWLNQNPNKIVIAPKKWFKEIPTNIIPPAWMKI